MSNPNAAVMVAFALGCLVPLGTASEEVFHVSAAGNDDWSGRLAQANATQTDGPLATLEGARDAIRALKSDSGLPAGGVTLQITPGIYQRHTTFELDAQDSGSSEAPIVYRGDRTERPRFMGGPLVHGFAQVSDETIRRRLDPACVDQILVADLRAQGIEDYGTLLPQGFGRGGSSAALELYFAGERMQLARWPNAEWARIAGVPEEPDAGVFTYSGDRPERWSEESDVWVHGYWTWDWADSFEEIVRFDKAAKRVFTQPPHGVYGYKQGARFYFLNILEELDAPGEWYLDRRTGLLYFWPPFPLE